MFERYLNTKKEKFKRYLQNKKEKLKDIYNIKENIFTVNKYCIILHSLNWDRFTAKTEDLNSAHC